MALRIPLKWLADFVEPSLPPKELAERQTLAGLEVESITAIGADWDPEKLRVGRVVEVKQHPDADRLCLATVNYSANGAEPPLTVVTGAPNVVACVEQGLGEKPFMVAFALVGAELIDGHSEDGRKMKLKSGKIRGVVSEGMVCSEYELGVSEEHEGIMVLPHDAPVGASLREYMGDYILEYDIKGGFSHLQSVLGIGRETAVLTDKKLIASALNVGRDCGETITPAPSFIDLEIADPALCSRYVAILIEGVKVQEAPFWMRQRLIQAGMRPINAIVDATNYVMLELGQPLHAFDYKTIGTNPKTDKPTICVRRAEKGEQMHTLDEVERTFDTDMLLITDGNGPVAVAGVMGGAESEISEDTTTVLLESANFEFLNIRRTSQLLKLRTEASDRFGKKLDPELCLPAALRAAYLIAELCGGTVKTEYGDLYPSPPKAESVSLDLGFVARLLGIEIPRSEIVHILEALEFDVQGENPLVVTPPSHRMDIAIPADLVEEIGRIYGYDRMVPTLIKDELPPQRPNPPLELAERVRDIMTGCGLDEIITYSIISQEEDAWLHPEKKAPNESEYVSLINPLVAEKGHLRKRLLGEGLNTLRANLRFQSRALIFEVGAVFFPQEGEDLPEEKKNLCILLTGTEQEAFWEGNAEAKGFDFFHIKGIAETMAEGLGLGNVAWERGADAAYHPGRSARMLVNGRTLGDLGELHPRVVQAFGLPAKTVCALELDMDILLELWDRDHQMQPISLQPPVYEDLAFTVDQTTPAETIRAMIAQTGKPLLTEVRLFDHYTDEKLGKDKVSLAFALTYQAPDKTLTDKEVGKVRKKIIQRLEKELSAQLRA